MLRAFHIPLLAFALLLSGRTAAQDGLSLDHENVLFYGASAHYGKTINIHPFFPELEQAFSGEFELKFQTRGKKKWHQAHGYPEIGVSFNWMDFGNQKVMGGAFGAVPHLTFTKHFNARFSVNIQTGGGLAWFNKPFDAFDNPDNFVIGSRFTALANVSSHARFRLNDNFTLNLGGGMWHYSNGHLKVPNIGANVFMAKAGLLYHPNPIEPPKHADPHGTDFDNKIKYNVSMGLGWHEVEGTVLPFDGPSYPVYFGNFYVSKRKSYKSMYSLGLEYNYYTSFRDYIVSQDLFEDKIDLRSSKVVLFGGHEFFFGQLSFSTKVGGNLYFPVRQKMIDLGIYEKKFMHVHLSNELGVNYYFGDVNYTTKHKPYLGLSLKSIGGKADFVALRIGMAIGPTQKSSHL